MESSTSRTYRPTVQTQTAPPVASQPQCTGSPGAYTCLSLREKVQSDQGNQLKHCYPQLEYPYKARAPEPEWANCESASEDGFYGVYDPPRALVSAKSMAPKPTLDPGTRLSAAPGSSILPSWPHVTNSPGDTFPSKPSNPAIGNLGDLPPDQQPYKHNQESDPQWAGSQDSDPPVQEDPGSGKDRSLHEFDDQIEKFQRLPDPSLPGDSGPTPIVNWARSNIKPGESSQHSIPNADVLVPGAAAITSDDVAYR